MGTVQGLLVRPGRREATQDVESIVIEEGDGVVGDHGGDRKHRQVTVISQQAWTDTQAELGNAEVPWQTRRANILLTGLDLRETEGRELVIGSCRLKIHGELHPCGLMDELCDGLRAALDKDWRGGVICEVLEGGEVQMGDTATLE